MKKLMVGLLAAFLMTSGLVALSASSAIAACPYTGCFETEVSRAKTSSPSPGTARVVYKVTTVDPGNAVPRGKVKVIIKSANGVVRTKTSPYPANTAAVFSNLRKGKYTVIVKFIPAASSVYGPSDRSAKVTVR
jgi:hypothetical protein